jgi:acyl-coenzyme A synthetase/AMP-(fatty) acid ligase
MIILAKEFVYLLFLHQPFQIFHRTSTPAIIHLLRTAGAHRLLTTKLSLGSVVDTLSAELSAADLPYDLSIDEIPLLGQLYPHLGEETSRDPFVPYPSPTVRTPLDDVVMYLHSSGSFFVPHLQENHEFILHTGSTGLPKCIPETHRTLIHFATLGPLSSPCPFSFWC